MKFRLAVVTALVVAIPAWAQTAAAPGTTTVTITEARVVKPDALIMSSGSVLVLRDKATTRMAADMRLNDGSIVTPGGTVKRADGSTVTLADGQAISPAGVVGAAPAGVATDVPAVVEGAAVKAQ